MAEEMTKAFQTFENDTPAASTKEQSWINKGRLLALQDIYRALGENQFAEQIETELTTNANTTL